jgi:hypothetical protein
VNAADARFLRIIKLRIVVATLLEMLDALACARTQIIEPAEYD